MGFFPISLIGPLKNLENLEEVLERSGINVSDSKKSIFAVGPTCLCLNTHVCAQEQEDAGLPGQVFLEHSEFLGIPRFSVLGVTLYFRLVTNSARLGDV